MYRNIILLTIILGIICLLAILTFTFLSVKKKDNGRYIKVTNGTLKGKVYKFDGKLSIGTNPDKCDIVYPVGEPGVGTLHCTVQLHDNALYLVDNFSRYGTYLEDGTRIEATLPYKIENERFAFYIVRPENSFEFINKKEFKK